MLRKVMFFGLMFIMTVGLTVVSSEEAFAAVTAFGNGGFETGDFSNWMTFGDVWIDTAHQISGNYTAVLENDDWDYLGSLDCTSIASGFQYPANVPKSVNVSFKVRYATNWDPGYLPQDPAHAVVWVPEGAVNAFTINAAGVNPGSGFSVTRLDTNANVSAPTVPPFISGFYWDYETPVLLVTGTIPSSSCYGGTSIEFDICNMLEFTTFSGLWVDDVSISYSYQPNTGTNGTWWKTQGYTPCY